MALVVDDDTGQRMLLRVALQREGYDVYDAADGAGALELLKIIEPSLIMLDLEMPGMSGLDFLEARRAQSLAPKAEIIIHSSDRATLTPPDCYRLHKPFRRDEFLLLLKVIAARRATDAPHV
jgi:CheY-like chemotaxis protein